MVLIISVFVCVNKSIYSSPINKSSVYATVKMILFPRRVEWDHPRHILPRLRRLALAAVTLGVLFGGLDLLLH